MNGNAGIRLKKDYNSIMKKFRRYETRKNFKKNLNSNDFFDIFNNCCESNNENNHFDSSDDYIKDKNIFYPKTKCHSSKTFSKKLFMLGMGMTLGFIASKYYYKNKYYFKINH